MILRYATATEATPRDSTPLTTCSFDDMLLDRDRSNIGRGVGGVARTNTQRKFPLTLRSSSSSLPDQRKDIQ
ncbi:hypothetical protein VNO78_11793 [Psophocarpus tetragonolobus]|uniref:Uncharacterized protein n=1 Tax=Psophocarpus tetragonolobus TaxID=3891 RepID=A0AAN9XNI7_PSOTE